MEASADDRRDDDFVGRLPLPLAQLYRRTRNAKSALDRHHNAYYLAEATLKLAACARIGVALAQGLEPRSELARNLEDLCLPSIGHWVGFLRGASLFLEARPDAALLPLAGAHEKLLRAEPLPAVRAFAERAARAEGGEQPALAADLARDAGRKGILGFFNLVAAYRNQVFGHGAQRLGAFYEEVGPLLLDAACEVLGEECLFGGLTLAVARWNPDPAGRAAAIEWQGLEGLGSLTLPESRAGEEPAGFRGAGALREAIWINLGGWGELWNPPEKILQHSHAVFDLAFSPDGTRLATTSYRAGTRLWSVEAGEAIGPPFGDERGGTVAFSPGGKVLLTVSGTGKASLWTVETRELLETPLFEDLGVSMARFSPQGTRVVAACAGNSARIWSIETGSPVGRPMQHADRIRCVAVSPDGKRILTGCPDGTAQLWSGETGEAVAGPLKHEAPVSAAAFSPPGTESCGPDPSDDDPLACGASCP